MTSLLRKAACLSVFFFIVSSLGWSDSLQLKDGRHYVGNFAGGTEGVLAFQTEGSVQYFSVSDVVLLVFGDSREQAITPMSKRSDPSSAVKPRPSHRSATDGQQKVRLQRSSYKAISY